MKARWIVVSFGFAMVLAAGGFQAATTAPAEKKFEATCPVSGQPAIEKSVVALKDGANVYFCCENCPKAFKASPAKFALAVGRQLLETGQIVQVACPVSGQPVNKETLVEVGKAKAGFCCENCQAKFTEADDEGKLKIMFAELQKGFTNQTKCPVSGKPIDAQYTADYKDQKVYFCCPNCPKAFEANPARFAAKLPARPATVEEWLKASDATP
jgi:YHS domain-containing protein